MLSVPGVKVIEFASEVIPKGDLQRVLNAKIPGCIERFGLMTIIMTCIFAIINSHKKLKTNLNV